MKIKACIFDLDGTLLETRESIARPVNNTLRALGLPEQPVQNFGFYAGDGIDTTLRRALADAGDPDGAHFDEGIEMCLQWYREDPNYLVRPYPHIPELLAELKKRGIRCAVVSNKPHENAIPVVHHFFGDDIFDHIQGESSEVPKKPDPTGVLTTLERFGLSREECLYLGDTNTDMKTAHNAGLFAIGVTWGFRPRSELEENRADAIIDDPLEALEIVEHRRHI